MKQQSNRKNYIMRHFIISTCQITNITENESRIMRWAGHLTHIGIQEISKKFSPKTLREKAILIYLSTDKRKY
jgi:hypothetical protein